MSERARQLQETIAMLSRELVRELMHAPEAAAEAPFLTVPDFAARYQISPRTVRRMIREGMPVDRPRKRAPRIKVADAERWIAANRTQREASETLAPVH